MKFLDRLSPTITVKVKYILEGDLRIYFAFSKEVTLQLKTVPTYIIYMYAERSLTHFFGRRLRFIYLKMDFSRQSNLIGVI